MSSRNGWFGSESVERLSAVAWFEACGSVAVEPLPGAVQVATWGEVAERCVADEWEHAQAEAASALTVHLHRAAPSRYQHWNAVVRGARDDIVEAIVAPAVRDLVAAHGLPPVLADAVGWDITHALVEEHFATDLPSRHFRDVFSLYEAGHLVCGWSGVWPQGAAFYF